MITYVVKLTPEGNHTLGAIVDGNTPKDFSGIVTTEVYMDDWRRFLIYCGENKIAFTILKDKAKGLLRDKYSKTKNEPFVLVEDAAINELVSHKELIAILPLFAIWLQQRNIIQYVMAQRNYHGKDLKNFIATSEIINDKDYVVNLLKVSPELALKLNVNGQNFTLDCTNRQHIAGSTLDAWSSASEDAQRIYGMFTNHMQAASRSYTTQLTRLSEQLRANEETLRTKIFNEMMTSMADFVNKGWTFDKQGNFIYNHRINCTHVIIAAGHLKGKDVKFVDTDDLLTIALPKELSDEIYLDGFQIPYSKTLSGASSLPLPAGKRHHHPHQTGGDLCIGDFAGRPFKEIIGLPEALTQVNWASQYGNTLLDDFIGDIIALPKEERLRYITSLRGGEHQDIFGGDNEIPADELAVLQKSMDTPVPAPTIISAPLQTNPAPLNHNNVMEAWSSATTAGSQYTTPVNAPLPSTPFRTDDPFISAIERAITEDLEGRNSRIIVPEIPFQDRLRAVMPQLSDRDNEPESIESDFHDEEPDRDIFTNATMTFTPAPEPAMRVPRNAEDILDYAPDEEVFGQTSPV